MTDQPRTPGWQQPATTRSPKCLHTGAVLASITVGAHAEGHEWVCGCGQVFVVVSNGGRDKRLVRKAGA